MELAEPVEEAEVGGGGGGGGVTTANEGIEGRWGVRSLNVFKYPNSLVSLLSVV